MQNMITIPVFGQFTQLDTGAAKSIISEAMAQNLGLTPGEAVTFTGYGGQVEGYMTTMDVKLGDHVFKGHEIVVDPSFDAPFDGALWWNFLTQFGLAPLPNPITGKVAFYDPKTID